MDKIVLKKTENPNQIKVWHPFNDQLFWKMKSIENAVWNKADFSWILPKNKDTLPLLFKTFRGIAWIDMSELKNETRKENPQAPKIQKMELPAISEESKTELVEFIKHLKSKRYSENTIKTYADALSTFLRFYHFKPIEEIENEDLIRFNNEYILGQGLSSSFQNQIVNAIKLYFSIRKGMKLNPELVHRPRREKLLPNVLSKEEVKAILEAPTNLKHRAMLSLIYACGLRRSELLNLTFKDIHSERNLLLIKQSKGKKDRIVPISNKIIDLLRDYYKAYKPKTWLFEGQNGGEKYSEESLAKVLKQSLTKTNIQKPVTLHWLRHSYATHLLENGTDIRYIQELLGHSSSRTTEIYTHVSTRNIQNIVSPFDML
jgi:integrase/recombinase XerD